MANLPAFISDLALLLIVAGITTLLFRKINQPVVIGYIVAGILVSPVMNFIPSITDTANITVWADIGVIFLMFSLGLEFSLHKLVKVGSTGVITAGIVIFGMLGVGIAIGSMLGWSTMDKLFLGGMLSMSSTTIIIKTFDDLHLRGKKWTESVFATLVIEDIAAVFMMIILSTISVSKSIGGEELIFTIGKLLFYLALWLLLGIFIIPSFIKKTQRLMSNETLLVVSLGICFGMVWLASELGFSSALGAFLAGSILAGTIHAERVAHLVAPCKDLFGAVFFVSVGIMIVPSMLLQYIVPIIIVTLAVIVGMIIFATIGMLLAGQKLQNALNGAFSLAQIGEFSFIIANLGHSLGVTGDFLYPIVVAVSVITTFTTPLLIGISDKAYKLLCKILPGKFLQSIDRYAESHAHIKNNERGWSEYLKGYFSTFVIYTVIILGVIELGISLLLPWLSGITEPWMAKLAVLIIILLISSPFVSPLLYFRNRYFISLWLDKFSNRVPLTALVLLRTAATVILLIIPVLRIYNLPFWLVIALALVAAIFISRSDWLTGQYLQIEAHFLTNFNERQLQQLEQNKNGHPSHAWLDEQLFVMEFLCHEQSSAQNISLFDLSWGKSLNIIVMKIIRGKKHINTPIGTEQLLANDHFFVMGDKKQVENFAKASIKKNWATSIPDSLCTLRDFISTKQEDDQLTQVLCTAVRIDQSLHNLIGKSIKDSGIKEMWGGLLIGLERDYYPITHPNPNMLLKEGDLLWLLGDQKMAGRLLKTGMLGSEK